MRKKDFNNTYASKPENFTEHMNESTGTYTKSSVISGIKTENKDFVQINIKYQAELAELAITEPAARAIFDLFVTRMENNNTYITSTTKLAEAIRRDPRTAQRALKVLKERNFLVLYFKVSGNHGNAYFINPHIACKCGANQKQFLIEKYLTISEDKTYRASEDIINVKALVDKDRLVLKSDEKKQLDTLNRLDNVKIHGMVQIANLLNDLDQQEILDVIQMLKKKVPTTDEELARTEDDIKRREKGIELMKEKKRLMKEGAEEAIQLEIAKQKYESGTDNAVLNVLMDSYWKDALEGK